MLKDVFLKIQSTFSCTVSLKRLLLNITSTHTDIMPLPQHNHPEVGTEGRCLHSASGTSHLKLYFALLGIGVGDVLEVLRKSR